MPTETTIERSAPPQAALPAFDAAMRGVTPAYRGVMIRKGVFVIITEGATSGELDALTTAALAHDYAARTTEQQAAEADKTAAGLLLPLIETALSDIATKQAAFQSAPTLATAGPLLLEISQDMTGVLKTLRYIIRQGGLL